MGKSRSRAPKSKTCVSRSSSLPSDCAGRETSMFRVSNVSEGALCACSDWACTVSADSDAVGETNETRNTVAHDPRRDGAALANPARPKRRRAAHGSWSRPRVGLRRLHSSPFCPRFQPRRDQGENCRLERWRRGDVQARYYWKARKLARHLDGVLPHGAQSQVSPASQGRCNSMCCCLTMTRRKCCCTKFAQTTRPSRPIGTAFNRSPAGGGVGDDRGGHRHKVRPL